MNNKGFTLVEILATFVILSMILIIAFPAIDNLYNENKSQIYTTYEAGLKAAAKLYVDQYDRDLFDNSTTSATCVILEFNDLKCEGLIKEFKGHNKSDRVDTNNTFVYATKTGTKVTYDVHLIIKNGTSIVYPSTPKVTKSCTTSRLKGVCS